MSALPEIPDLPGLAEVAFEDGRRWSRANEHDHDRDPEAIEVSLTIAATLKPKRIEWVWKGRIARGKLTVAGGDPGGGKSMLSVDLAARMITARKWPDGTQAPKCKSGLVSAEDDPEDTIVPRLIAHNADLAMIVFPGALDLSTDADSFFDSCKAAGVEVVFIDPISAFVGPDTNTWRDSDMRRFLKPIAAAAARTNIAVVLIVHLTKANGTKALYRFQGSIAQAAAPRMAFLIAPLPSDPEVRVMAAVKNNIGQKASSLSYRITSTYVAEVEDDIGRIEWLGAVALTDSDLLQPEGEGRALDRAEEFLLEYLADGPKPSKDCEAAAKLKKIGHNTLWDAKKELGIRSRKDGLDRWLWALPSARIEPSRSESDASGLFSSDPTHKSHTNKDSSLNGNRDEASFRIDWALGGAADPSHDEIAAQLAEEFAET
jgi:putative DNA primase/helicase